MRVCFVSHFGGLGGAERSLLELICALSAHHIEPVLLAPGPSDLERAALALQIPVVRVPVQRLRRSRAGLVRSVVRLPRGWAAVGRVLREVRPRIVHANSGHAMAWIGPSCRLARIPAVWHWRDFDAGAHLQLLATACDLAVTISGAVQRHAERVLGGRLPVRCVGHGVAEPPRIPEHAARRWRTTSTEPLVVMAGQAVERKGHDVFIEAIARARERWPGLRGVIACPSWDPASTWIDQIRTRAESVEGIEVVGELPSVTCLFRAADVVIVPSRREPFGRVAVEAMWAGRAVIASEVDGLSEIVSHGETGLLVPPGDPAALALALEALLENPRRRHRMGGAGRVRARTLFTPSRVASATIDVYETLRRSGDRGG